MNVHSNIIRNSKKWKQFKCPSTENWINKSWDIHTVRLSSALKREEIWIHGATWVELASIMLSNGLLCLACFTQRNVDQWFPGTRGKGGWRVFNEYKMIFRMMKMFWDQVVLMAAQHFKCTKSHSFVYLEVKTMDFMLYKFYLNLKSNQLG